MNLKFLPFLIFIISGLLPSATSADEKILAVDPSDIFFRGYQTTEAAKKLEKEEKFGEAWQKYLQAAKYYESLKRFHSNWKPEVVDRSLRRTSDFIAAVEPKAVAELTAKNEKNKLLIEGGIAAKQQPNDSRLGSNHVTTNQPAPGNSQSIRSTNDKLRLEMLSLEKQNESLKAELKKANTSASSSPDLVKIADLQRRLAEKDAELKNVRSLLARAPMQQDLDRINQEKLAREKEINLVASALHDSKRKLESAEQRANEKQAEADLASKQLTKLKEEMAMQQDINNQVIVKQRKELKELSNLLESTRKELGASRAEIANLSKQLEQSQNIVAELTEERNSLRTERDALKDFLEQNDSKKIQKIIAENIQLGAELKQTTDRLNYLEQSNDATKDELVEAKSDLAIAKTRIIQYQEKQGEQLVRMKALNDELAFTQEKLALAEKNGGSSVDQEEVEILKSTVKRLIKAQERRQKSAQILWDTYQKSKTTIAGMATAFKDIRDEHVELSNAEKVLLAERLPDQEFQSPLRVPDAHAEKHRAALENEINSFMPLVVRFYEKESYEAARQILADLDERSPGNMQILCTRGIIELKTKNYSAASEFFNEAITMNEESDYAHYMLGVTYYDNQDFDNARNSFDRALSLKPTNERTHLYLGCIAGMGMRFEQSEEHFLTAIKLDPTYADAYYNLSALYLLQERKFDALQYYQKSLQNGKNPNEVHEKAINQLKG